jgi:hypothetical protein
MDENLFPLLEIHNIFDFNAIHRFSWFGKLETILFKALWTVEQEQEFGGGTFEYRQKYDNLSFFVEVKDNGKQILIHNPFPSRNFSTINDIIN